MNDNHEDSLRERITSLERELEELRSMHRSAPARAAEQARLETSLRESEEKFRLAFHANPLSINLNRMTDGMYLDINEGFTRLMGYTPEDVLGKSSLELSIWVDPTDRQKLVSGLTSTGRVDGLRARFRRKNGDIGIGVMSARVLKIGGETVVLSLTSDITQEVDLEERFRQAQKMEAIGRLAGGVAHDFNNLLIPILSYAEMVKESMSPDDQRRSMLDEILRAGNRAAGLIRQILAFSRKQVLEVRSLDLGALVKDLKKMLVRLLKEDIELRTELKTGICVRADRTQIEQILMNLAVNSGDAMPDGGVITISVQEETLVGGMIGRFAEEPTPGRYAVIAVRDTGIGMDGATQQHVFEPFFTTKAAGKGTGLGLATVFGIVKQHGGYIWVYSEHGLGTTFKIYLPLCEGAVEAALQAPRPPQAFEGSEAILVVDDERSVRTLVCDALAAHGYRVIAAENTAAALRMLEDGRLNEGLRLLVTDVIMPGMNGKELHHILQNSIASLRVLFMSGYADEVIGRHGLIEAGVNFLQKPFEVQGLLLKVRAVLDG
jgi:two-component system cell cycle sensor histidine kinase/response regulator CckA